MKDLKTILTKFKELFASLAELETDGGRLFAEEFAEGYSVFVLSDGSYVEAPNGVYSTGEKDYTVVDGVITSVADTVKPVEEPKQEPEDKPQNTFAVTEEMWNDVVARLEKAGFKDEDIAKFNKEKKENYSIYDLFDDIFCQFEGIYSRIADVETRMSGLENRLGIFEKSRSVEVTPEYNERFSKLLALKSE